MLDPKTLEEFGAKISALLANPAEYKPAEPPKAPPGSPIGG